MTAGRHSPLPHCHCYCWAQHLLQLLHCQLLSLALARFWVQLMAAPCLAGCRVQGGGVAMEGLARPCRPQVAWARQQQQKQRLGWQKLLSSMFQPTGCTSASS